MRCAFVNNTAFTPDASAVGMIHFLSLLIIWGIVLSRKPDIIMRPLLSDGRKPLEKRSLIN